MTCVRNLSILSFSFHSSMALHQIQTGGHSVGAGGDCKMFCQCWCLSYTACVVLRITLDCELDFFLLKYLTHFAFSILNIYSFLCGTGTTLLSLSVCSPGSCSLFLTVFHNNTLERRPWPLCKEKCLRIFNTRDISPQ